MPPGDCSLRSRVENKHDGQDNVLAVMWEDQIVFTYCPS